MQEDALYAESDHKVLAGGFDELFVAKVTEPLVLQLAPAQLLRLRLAARRVILHDELPSARGERLVVGRDVSFGEGETQRRPAVEFVFGLDDFLRFRPTGRAEAFAFTCDGIEVVVGVASLCCASIFLPCRLSG
jgi:hypothetical protein